MAIRRVGPHFRGEVGGQVIRGERSGEGDFYARHAAAADKAEAEHEKQQSAEQDAAVKGFTEHNPRNEHDQR